MNETLDGSHVRDLREQQSWSQRELGRKAGLPQATISVVERSPRFNGLAATVRIARALGMTVDALLQYEGKEETEDADTRGVVAV